MKDSPAQRERQRQRLAAAGIRARARAEGLVVGLRERLAVVRARRKAAPPKSRVQLRLDAIRSRQRRRRLLLGLLAVVVLLLLSLLRDCSCAPPPEEEPVAALECPVVPECECGPKKPAKPVTKKKPRVGIVPAQPRDRLGLPYTGTPAWLADFRLQVTARSLELAVCFNDSEKPGALRWTTTVTPRPGTVADSEIEPVLRGPPMTSAQKDCVLRSLSTQPYRLTPDGDDDVGSRVSLVLEF